MTTTNPSPSPADDPLDWIEAAIEAVSDYAIGYSEDWMLAEEGSQAEEEADRLHERYTIALRKLVELKATRLALAAKGKPWDTK